MMRRWLQATSLLALLAAPPLHAQAADSARALPAASSWTSDRRAFRTGDLITVLVDESTLAVQDRSESAAQDRSTRGSLSGALATGTTRSGADVGVQTGFGGSSSRRGQARHQDRLTAELTVRVTAIEPGGTLRVEGAKSLVVDGREQKVTLAGLVRPADISPQNVVDSWRVADVSIAYAIDGKLSTPKRSMIARVLGIVWP